MRGGAPSVRSSASTRARAAGREREGHHDRQGAEQRGDRGRREQRAAHALHRPDRTRCRPRTSAGVSMRMPAPRVSCSAAPTAAADAPSSRLTSSVRSEGSRPRTSSAYDESIATQFSRAPIGAGPRRDPRRAPRRSPLTRSASDPSIELGRRRRDDDRHRPPSTGSSETPGGSIPGPSPCTSRRSAASTTKTEVARFTPSDVERRRPRRPRCRSPRRRRRSPAPDRAARA